MKKLLLSVSVLILAGTGMLAQKPITLEDVWKKNTFKAEYSPGFNSMKDGEHYTDYAETGMVTEPAYVVCDYKSGEQTSVLFKLSDLIPAGQTKPVSMEFYDLSPDESKMLVVTESEKIYRYSFKSTNYIYDLKTREMFPLSNNGKQRLAQFSPDGKKVAFVRENNIFVVDLDTRKESQVTTDGEWNKIINGGTDWVYEEEFALPNGMAWSPDSKRLAFYRFDESRVKEFGMTMYNTGLYPQPYSFKYPKAGEENSIVTIHIYDLGSKQVIPVDIGKETDQYIPRIKWTKNPNQLCVYRMNRLQNKLELLMADAASGSTSVFYTETDKKYIEINDDMTFLPDGKSFLWSSDKDGHQHLYQMGIDGKQLVQITSGAWDVVKFYGYDEKNKTLFYQSNEGNDVQRGVYSVALSGKNKKRLSAQAGTNDAAFSEGMKYYINTYSNANQPYYISLHSSDGKQVKVIRENKKLAELAKDYGFVKKEFFTFKNRDGITLNGWMMKPEFPAAGKKYPVLQTVYGGPGHNTVNDQWEGGDFYWYQMLVQQGYIIVSVDNRGTEYRGAEFKKSTYGQMGKLESADQIDAAKYLGTLPYVDSKRIAIWGWSYGGYMSSLCLAVGADFFKMAMAVAPVSSWRFYDSVYTERYMGMPQDNAKGYDEFSPMYNMDKVRGKLLLVHGTADDNVHFQNSIELTNALIKAEKQYDFFMFPDKNHSIRGGNARFYLYTKMTDYLKANL